MGTDREADKLKIKQILTATIVSLCNNGLSFESELSVEGLLGITLDRKDVLLVNIKEVVNSSAKKKPKSQDGSAAPAASKQPQTGVGKQQQQLHQQQHQNQQQQQSQQQKLQNKQQQPQMPRKQQQQQQQPVHAQQEHPPTPGKSSAQDTFGRVKVEPMLPKVVSESQTQCMAVQPYGGGYAQVQKSVKMVQHAQGVVEQKQMEWRTYAADGRVLEHKKVQEVQTVAPSGVSVPGSFTSQPMASTASGMSGYPGPNIKVEPHCEEMDDMYGGGEDEYYDDEEEGYDDYDCMQGAYAGDGAEQFSASAGYQDHQQFGGIGGDGVGAGHVYHHQVPASGRAGRGGVKKTPMKRPKKEKATPSKMTPNKKFQKSTVGAVSNPSSCKNTPVKSTSKEVNSSLVQRALDLVNEGKLSAADAINLFGIPKSTFYKKLATSNAGKDQFAEDDMDGGAEEPWDDEMQGDFAMMDPTYSNYSA